MEELGLGQPAIAWHTVRDSIAEVGCFLGLVGGTLGKISMDVKLMMQTEVGRGLRAVRARPRLEQHDAAEAQSDLVVLHPRRRVGRAPARGGADGRDDRRSRALDRAVGDRVDRAARGVLPDGRRAEADALRARRARSRCGEDARQHRHHQRARDVGGGDDGPRPLHRPRIRARPRLRHLPRGDRARTARCSISSPRIPEINRHLDRAALARLCDPANYLGQAGHMVDRVLESRARAGHA